MIKPRLNKGPSLLKSAYGDWQKGLSTKAAMVLGVSLFTLLLSSSPTLAQQNWFPPADTLHSKRLTGLSLGAATVYGGAMYGLNELWYAQYERSRFHWNHEWDYWNQLDKAGHAYSAYYQSVAAYHLLGWSGVKPAKRLWMGGLAGLILQTPIEVLDGFSKKWGASGGDAAANAFGSALFIGQQLAWEQQRLRLKFSHNPSPFAARQPDILGNNAVQELLKDYNSQTYWLSVSVNDLLPRADGVPPWLSIAGGYGATGMLGNDGNPDGFPNIERRRTYQLALAVNTARFHTESRFLNTLLDALSALKLPLPGIQYDRVKGFQGQWIAY